MIHGIVAGQAISATASISATYWRLYISSVQSGAYAAISELEMRSSAGGSDQCSGGTPSASSILTGSYDQTNAFDNTSSIWSTTGDAPPAWISYHFPTSVIVKEVAITAADASINSHLNDPKDFAIQYSNDGATWTTLWSVTGQTSWSDFETRVFTKP